MVKTAKEEQILELINQNSSVLICLPEEPSTDAIASGLALLSTIEKLNKKGKVVSSGFQLPANHTFLPKSDEIFDDVTSLRKFVISLDTSQTSVDELSYNIEGDKLKIYISPKDGFFSEEHVSTENSEYSYDLIIIIDSQDLETLGRIYDMNTEFFYHTPIVNIDHSPANDHFGQINLVNVTATSTSEIIFELIKDWEGSILDEYIATNLLTGMISKTKSFQSGTITPRSLAIASHLISQGARREEIVKHLYQSKKVSTLKLWGRALSKLEADFDHKIVWSLLSKEDFEQSGTKEKDLSDVIDELIINTPEAKNVFLLFPGEGAVRGMVSTAPYIDALELFHDFSAQGSEHFVTFSVEELDIKEIESKVLEMLRQAIQVK